MIELTTKDVPRFDAERLLTGRLRTLAPNPITEAMVRVGQLTREGNSIINFSVGEPDFDTPEFIREAGVEAIRSGKTRYTPTDGTVELKSAIRAKFARENGLDYDLAQISVGSGAKQVIYNALTCTLEIDDEVIIPAPYWTSYPEVVTICGGKPVIIPCAPENSFKLSPDNLRNALTARTKWLILNSPSNPSGATYTAAEVLALAKVISDHPSVMVLADDMYEHFVYRDEPFVTIAQAAPELYDRTLTVNGVSKTYAMTGWRIGYGGGPASLIRAMFNLQSQATSNPCSISQSAAVGALNGQQNTVEQFRSVFRSRRDLLLSELAEAPTLKCPKPDGAFYAYVNCQGIIGRRTPSGRLIGDDRDFTRYLLESQHVATVHGAAFGLSPYFRISYATSTDEIIEGCKRIRNACGALQ